jgi:hypothetical protein
VPRSLSFWSGQHGRIGKSDAPGTAPPADDEKPAAILGYSIVASVEDLFVQQVVAEVVELPVQRAEEGSWGPS